MINNSADETLKELIVGIIVYGTIVQILVCFIATGNLSYFSLGLWIGVVVAIGMAFHMKRSIEDALDLGEAGAAKHMRKMYTLRYVSVAIIFGATVYFDVGSPITLLVGVLGLKIGAYLQPYTHKVLLKLKKSK
ncbi:hypothetical protein [Faecalimonas sp.]